MKIITISREFGSGGRELGRRLAQTLRYDYYDGEIITAIAEKCGLDEGYVETTLEDRGWQGIPLTLHNTLTSPMVLQSPQINLLLEQKQVIEEIGKTGRNCVIVGRNADTLLEDRRPFNLFVCARMDARVRRCVERAGPGEDTSPKEIEKRIRRVDKNRARTREILTSSPWGHRESYHLIINTTGWDIEALIPLVAEFATKWFDTCFPSKDGIV